MSPASLNGFMFDLGCFCSLFLFDFYLFLFWILRFAFSSYFGFCFAEQSASQGGLLVERGLRLTPLWILSQDLTLKEEHQNKYIVS